MTEKLWYRCRHKASVLEKARSVTEALVGHIATGSKTLTNEQTEKRLEICYNCDKYVNGSCSICGCRLRTKARWVGQKCPLGKW